MTFNEAKAVLRQHGYNITPMRTSIRCAAEYRISRIAIEDGRPEIKQWLFTAQTVKDGVYRAMSLAGMI